MPDYPTEAELFRIGRDAHLARSSAITREVLDQEGTDANALIALAAAMGTECIGQLSRVESGLFYETARGDRQRRLAWDRDQVLMRQASPSTVILSLSTGVGAPGAFGVQRGDRFGAGGKEFVALDGVTYPAGSVGPVVFSAQSALAGADQQVTSGAVNSIISPLVGMPADLLVTNPYASFGGADTETEEAFGARMQRYYVARRRGTLAALELAALEFAGAKTAYAFEVLDPYGVAARLNEVCVADEFTESLLGSSSSAPSSYAVQAAAFSLALQDWMRDYRCGGIGVVLTVANVSILPVALGLRYTQDANPSVVAQQAIGRTVSYVNSLVPGASYSSSALEAVLAQIPGLTHAPGSVLSPIGVVTTNPTTVLRTYRGSVSLGAA